ncbi:hypothetical protein HK100_011266, partial [Physocladia obscura]
MDLTGIDVCDLACPDATKSNPVSCGAYDLESSSFSVYQLDASVAVARAGASTLESITSTSASTSVSATTSTTTLAVPSPFLPQSTLAQSSDSVSESSGLKTIATTDLHVVPYSTATTLSSTTTDTPNSSNTALVAGIVFGVIVMIVIAICTYKWGRWKGKQDLMNSASLQHTLASATTSENPKSPGLYSDEDQLLFSTVYLSPSPTDLHSNGGNGNVGGNGNTGHGDDVRHRAVVTALAAVAKQELRSIDSKPSVGILLPPPPPTLRPYGGIGSVESVAIVDTETSRISELSNDHAMNIQKMTEIPMPYSTFSRNPMTRKSGDEDS